MQCSIISKIHTFKAGKYHYLAQTNNTKVPVISIHSETAINCDKQFTLALADIKPDWQDEWIEKQIIRKKIQNNNKAAAMVDNGALYTAVKDKMQELVDDIDDIQSFGPKSAIKRQPGFTLNSVRGLLEVSKANNVRILCKIRSIEWFRISQTVLVIYLAEAENTQFQIIDWTNRIDESETNYNIPMDTIVIFNNLDWSKNGARAHFGFKPSKSYVLHSFNKDMGDIINGRNPKYPIHNINQTIWQYNQAYVKKLDFYNIRKRKVVQNFEEAMHKSSADIGTAYMYKVNAEGLDYFNAEVELQKYCNSCGRFHPIQESCKDAINSNITLKIKGDIESAEFKGEDYINVQYKKRILQKMYTYFKRRRLNLEYADSGFYHESLGPNSEKTFVFQNLHKDRIQNYLPLIKNFFKEVKERKDAQFLFSVIRNYGRNGVYTIHTIEEIKLLDIQRGDNNNINNESQSNNLKLDINRKRSISAVSDDSIESEPEQKKPKLSKPET